jgi:hypothetical protein
VSCSLAETVVVIICASCVSFTNVRGTTHFLNSGILFGL